MDYTLTCGVCRKIAASSARQGAGRIGVTNSAGMGGTLVLYRPMTQRLTDEQVRHVAKLSRLRLSDDEVHHFALQLSKVLDYVSKLGELNLDGVEPMTNAMDLTNVLREDVEEPGMTVERALMNAPDQAPPFFKVPKVLGDGSGA